MKRCEECYSDDNRITPINKPEDCLENHLQYICGTCGRCICINKDEKRGLQRWNFPFKSLKEAILYLRTADYSTKTNCGIYRIENSKGRVSYKIFENDSELIKYLKNNKDKTCNEPEALFRMKEYMEFPNTEIRNLTKQEIKQYLNERSSSKD